MLISLDLYYLLCYYFRYVINPLINVDSLQYEVNYTNTYNAPDMNARYTYAIYYESLFISFLDTSPISPAPDKSTRIEHMRAQSDKDVLPTLFSLSDNNYNYNVFRGDYNVYVKHLLGLALLLSSAY